MHLAAANKTARHKAIKKMMTSHSNGGLQSIEDISRRESLTRMRKYRTDRNALWDGIIDANIKRIAVHLDQIKDNKKCVVVPHIISNATVPDNVKFVGKAKQITFSNEGVPSKRAMQLVKNPKKILSGSVPRGIETPLLYLSAFHYSAVISVEETTRLLLGKALEGILIPLHSMIFFRGDIMHAGAAYSVSNRRLFLSSSLKSFPTSEDVLIRFDE